MIGVGTTATLSVKPRDSDNNPLVVDDLTVTLTLPDGATAGPFNAAGTAEKYSYDYPTVQAGRHVINWSGTGFGYGDVLNVWPTDPRLLISLPDAKQALRSEWNSSTDDDDALRLMLAAVTPVIEDIVGTLAITEYTETHDGGASDLLLDHFPVDRATVTVSVNGTETTSFVVDEAAGIITANPSTDGGSDTCLSRSWDVPRFGGGRGSIEVTYTAGRSLIPPNILEAAQEELRFLWQNGRQGGRPSFGGVDTGATELAYTPSGYAVPNRVVELCHAHHIGKLTKTA